MSIDPRLGKEEHTSFQLSESSDETNHNNVMICREKEARAIQGNSLTYALRRLRQRPDWRSTGGLSSLLAAANALPRRDPWSLPSVEDGGGLAGLLEEARQWHEERRHGA